jgi:phosphatidylglycerol:prolipoprotein diacylglycerol transferase
MYPELLNLPPLPSVKSYGTFMVLGFLTALFLMRYLGRRLRLDPILLTNAALYTLIAGIVGARIFYVLHHFDQFKGNLLGVFAIWRGGLEFLGGVVLAMVFLVGYLRRHRLPVRRILDIMAIGLMAGLMFGRVGCLLNGCCWGKPTDLPWGIRFPYRSFAYRSQIEPNPGRGRTEPHLHLPQSYMHFDANDGGWSPKPLEWLTEQQRREVQEGRYRCLPVHPSQSYASMAALAISAVLYLLWRQSLDAGLRPGWWRMPGLGFCLMLVLYGMVRYLLELTRDDNPFEVAQLTISQLIGLGMIVLGLALAPVMVKMGPGKPVESTPTEP